MSTNASEGADQLSVLIDASIKNHINSLDNNVEKYIHAGNGEILKLLKDLKISLDTLTELTSVKAQTKKSPKSGTSRGASTSTGYYINRLQYFKSVFVYGTEDRFPLEHKCYYTPEKFQEKYMTPDMLEALKNNQTILKKKDGVETKKAKATAVYNIIRLEKLDVLKSLSNEFSASKNEYSILNSPKQQEVEKHTPNKQ